MNQDGWHSLAATRQSFHSPEFWVPSWQCFRKVPQQMAGRGWGMAAGRWPVQEAVTANPLKEQNHTRRVGMQRKSCLTVGPLQPGKDDNPALSYKLIYKIPKLKNVTLVIVKQSSKPGSCLHSQPALSSLHTGPLVSLCCLPCRLCGAICVYLRSYPV